MPNFVLDNHLSLLGFAKHVAHHTLWTGSNRLRISTFADFEARMNSVRTLYIGRRNFLVLCNFLPNMKLKRPTPVVLWLKVQLEALTKLRLKY